MGSSLRAFRHKPSPSPARYPPWSSPTRSYQDDDFQYRQCPDANRNGAYDPFVATVPVVAQRYYTILVIPSPDLRGDLGKGQTYDLTLSLAQAGTTR